MTTSTEFRPLRTPADQLRVHFLKSRDALHGQLLRSGHGAIPLCVSLVKKAAKMRNRLRCQDNIFSIAAIKNLPISNKVQDPASPGISANTRSLDQLFFR